jgi:hypothetical protein
MGLNSKPDASVRSEVSDPFALAADSCGNEPRPMFTDIRIFQQIVAPALNREERDNAFSRNVGNCYRFDKIVPRKRYSVPNLISLYH